MGAIKMLQVAICDDQEIFVKKIRSIVDEYFGKSSVEYKVDVFLSGKEFADLKEKLTKYDIVFLDINMDELDGIQTAEILRKYNSGAYLVFITAFINYTLQGYKVGAIRYILKDYNNMKPDILEALDTISEKMNLMDFKVTYNFVEAGEVEISVKDIIYIENELHKVRFHILKNNQNIILELYKKLSDVEEDLPPEDFVRTHQSYLVNNMYIENLKRYEISLISGEKIPVSKSRYKEVQTAFMSIKGRI
ncbi:MAG: LytTR family DNA-binding domain-containing protein [Agathobacter sp.]|nr:LytTR family DNA-binding domain-containing protein [Agathobacter sp.]